MQFKLKLVNIPLAGSLKAKLWRAFVFFLVLSFSRLCWEQLRVVQEWMYKLDGWPYDMCSPMCSPIQTSTSSTYHTWEIGIRMANIENWKEYKDGIIFHLFKSGETK